MTKVTRIIQAELERRRLTGESYRSIAAHCNLSSELVRQRTQHLGVQTITLRPRRLDYSLAVALATDMPVRVVAAQLGVKKHTVWRALRVMRRGYP